MDKEVKNFNDETNKVDRVEVDKTNNLNDEDIKVDEGNILVENDILKKNSNIEKHKESNEFDSEANKFEQGCESKLENIKDKNKEDINLNQEETDEHQIESKLKKKTRNTIIIGTTIILLSGFYIGNTVSKYENKIFPGTSICKEDISNLDKEEFLSKVNKIKREIEKKEIQIDTEDKKYNISFKDLASKYNNDKLYEDIIKNQNDKNIFSKFISIVTKKDTNYNLYIDIDKKRFDDLKDEISQDINIECVEPKVIINGEKISYKEGEDGFKLDENTLYNDIKQNINKKNLLEDDISITAKLVKDTPKISINDLKTVNHKVSSYTTTYGSGNARGSNIENAASKIDDLLLMPGEEFSYEKTVGPVIASNGYKYAPVISNGQLVNGIGGGVCQVSSTLYNTQLNAGILPTERRNHSKPVSYVPRGLDATLASGSIDYKFKNTYEYPLVINTNAVNGRLTMEIWSNENALKGIEYKPVSYARGNVANAYLYGYDKNGNKVYEKHIDTSVYR